MSKQTIGEMFAGALKCETREQAQEWINAEIADFQQLYGYSVENARSIILDNLGYMAGYYDTDTAKKVYELFDAKHPIFGAPDDWPTDPEKIFQMGVELGEKLKEEKS